VFADGATFSICGAVQGTQYEHASARLTSSRALRDGRAENLLDGISS
jgi:hypothetical protein